MFDDSKVVTGETLQNMRERQIERIPRRMKKISDMSNSIGPTEILHLQDICKQISVQVSVLRQISKNIEAINTVDRLQNVTWFDSELEN